MKKNKQNYYVWADLVRVISIFLVVLLHTSAGLLYKWNSIPTDHWWAANIYDSFSRMSVPLFVMLSGALLLPKEESYTTFFTKRLKRIMFPWVFWTGVFVIWSLTFHGVEVHSFIEFKRLVIEVFFGEFWFLGMLFGVYLVTPLWRIFVKSATRNDSIFLFLLWFVGLSLLPFVGHLFHRDFLQTSPLYIQYSGYFVLGYQLSKMKVSSHRRKKLFWIWLTLSLSIAVLTFVVSFSLNSFSDLFYDFFNPIQVIISSSLFLFLLSLKEGELFSFLRIDQNLKQKKITHLVKYLSETAFGIYLCHPLFLDVLKRFSFLGADSLYLHPLIDIPILTLVAFFSSFFLIFSLRKIAVGRMIT
jgi:surface polysaccharide O-acyltransferase-like enzyme